MLNREKFIKEISDIACDGKNVAVVDGRPRRCDETPCGMCELRGGCNTKLKKWANSEYVEPSVDWSKVPVDTPILVKDSGDTCFIRRYFAKFENGDVYAWSDGRTSWSAGARMTYWECAKLAESEG